MYHTALLRSGGVAVAGGGNDAGQCDILAPATGATYTCGAAGGHRTIPLQSDRAAGSPAVATAAVSATPLFQQQARLSRTWPQDGVIPSCPGATWRPWLVVTTAAVSATSPPIPRMATT